MRQGVRCGKIAVVCRDISLYRAAVRYEFRMAEIPLYCDEPTTPEFSAPATAVRALLALLRGADMTEQLTVLAKTGLCDLTGPEVCALENYAYTWPLTAADWRGTFTRSAAGYAGRDTEQDVQTLADAEAARARQEALLASPDQAGVGAGQVDEQGQQVRVTGPFPAPGGTWLDALGL